MSLNDQSNLADYPICAASQVQRAGFRDIDEQAAQLAGHDQVYHQISPGAFHGRFLTADIGRGSHLFIEGTNRALLQSGCVPTGKTSFMFLLGEDHRCRFQSADFSSSDLAIMPYLSSFSVSCPADTNFCVITLDQGVLDEMPGPDRESSPADAFRLKAKQIEMVVGALRLLVRASLSLFEEPAMTTTYATTLRKLRQSIVATLEVALSAHCECPAGVERTLATHARGLVDKNLREIDVPTLCLMLGIPRRTLELAFRQEFGIGPSRYIKTLRLNHIRRELLAASRASIADVAASWGLWHPSHFAESYVALFNERPSETRAGSRLVGVNARHGHAMSRRR